MENLTTLEAFSPLPKIYNKYGYLYELIKRVDDVVIYSQKTSGKIIAYEVFEIRKQKASSWGNVLFEAKEMSPSSESWGKNAFTVKTILRAEILMKQILENIEKATFAS